jgi:hypothetical protein
MGAVALGALLVAVFLVIAAAMVWQDSRRRPSSEPVTYLIEDAAGFVHDRLPADTAGRLGRDDVRRILEWGLYHTQVVGPRSGGAPPVLGSGEALTYVMERAEAAGYDYDPLDVGAVMAAESLYLASIGAIGERVEEEPT